MQFIVTTNVVIVFVVLFMSVSCCLTVQYRMKSVAYAYVKGSRLELTDNFFRLNFSFHFSLISRTLAACECPVKRVSDVIQSVLLC